MSLAPAAQGFIDWFSPYDLSPYSMSLAKSVSCDRNERVKELNNQGFCSVIARALSPYLLFEKSSRVLTLANGKRKLYKEVARSLRPSCPGSCGFDRRKEKICTRSETSVPRFLRD